MKYDFRQPVNVPEPRSNPEKYGGQLQAWLEKQGYRALSEPGFAAYDPPWIIPFLRRNEVQITIEADHG
ncbi:MAG: heme-binding protein [Chlorobi bacterium]|nr:heme-binding protein [Chlorobiota bacterium]